MAAALKLQTKLGWDAKYSLIGGQVPSGDYVFVQVPKTKGGAQ
jgi:hypothetical protein